MSLATDILNAAANLSPKSKRRGAANYLELVYRDKPAARPKKTRKPKEYKAPKHKPIPGVYFCTNNGRWRTYFYDGQKDINLGEHPTQARAFAALRLYKLWRRRSHTDIPNKPEIRIYTRWD